MDTPELNSFGDAERESVGPSGADLASSADMWTLRAFKRQFHKAKEARIQLAEDARLKLELHVSPTSASGSLTVPPEDAANRFLVAMRRFLNPADRLYHESVLSVLASRFADDFEPGRLEAIRDAITRHCTGPFDLRFNTVRVSAAEAYELIYSSFYLKAGEDLPEVLRVAQATQPLGSMLWFEFYDYAISGFEIVSHLFDCVQRVESLGRLSSLDAAEREQCIFCLRTDRSFTSEEHILPEALENEELLLRRGLVCDQCNNGVLSALDSALLDFEPIALLRVLYTSATKSGLPPKATFQNMKIRKSRPGHLHLTAYDRSGTMQDYRTLPDGKVAFRLEAKGRRRCNGRLLARALYKIGLEMVAYDRGHGAACDHRYDHARAFVIEDASLVNDVLFLSKATPQPRIDVSWQIADTGTGLGLSIFGAVFLVNLEREPKMVLDDDLRASSFQVLPIRGFGPGAADPE